MSTASTAERIAPYNRLLEGISDKHTLPTFVLDAVGLTEATLSAEAERVGMLQTIAPMFRIVVFTDLPVFPLAHLYGWPIEHFPALEHRHRISSPQRMDTYANIRLVIPQQHYTDARRIGAVIGTSFAEQIAELLGNPALANIAHAHSDRSATPSTGSAQWSAVRTQLAVEGSAKLASSEGCVQLNSVGNSTGSIYVHGSSTTAHGDAKPKLPPRIFTCVALFDADSTLAFESAVYAELGRSYGTRLAVVRPWRHSSTLLGDSLNFIDLVITDREKGLSVLPEYSEAYSVIAGSNRFRWKAAELYSATRRVARTLALTNGRS